MAKKQAARKGKKVLCRRLSKSTLRSALVSGLKAKGGRKDLKFEDAPEVASKVMNSLPPEERAGYPVVLTKDSVDPRKWVTHQGVKIEVDFSRARWLPDDWGQGVKTTCATAKSKKGGGGGILTSFVGPDMKVFYHREKVEEYIGRKLTDKDGFNGQVKLAKLQATQAVQLARMQIKEVNKGGAQGLIGTDAPESLFKTLSQSERKHLPRKEEFHFCIISARRATSPEGVRDIFMVQSQLIETGIQPTWYVDEASLKDYRALGLNAVVGGKLCPSRNKALKDARKLKKICVQLSDDISAWEYRDGKQAETRDDDAANAAHAASRRIIASPLAAASFIVAKMRAAEDPKPKLGGVYMLGSCARAFAGPAFSRYNFILGDFFVVDHGSKVDFDEEMKLKEDYDFTCSHIKAHGSIMRCNRMTLNVKHYSNSGGAVTNRDSKGVEEKRNIAILNQKWPGVFRPNWKRKNEVIMKWPAAAGVHDDDSGASSAVQVTPRTMKAMKAVKKGVVKAVRKTVAGLSATTVVKFTGKDANQAYITTRCKKASGKSLDAILGKMKFKDASGHMATYGRADLNYDLQRGFLSKAKK
eukprot:CAMPEP_0197655014 /NCGR_PEP_ID=MMETSP1338-20131121/39196_1 /TAXON_ID=43686 ORGANISM="Pelagodinium beii, Strain RCC1491" /NCGR_SAMPLE_ID=MMETSP1338 /ASSEMBLY_ACC=CAM_ASM_000754 /LENGTH=584 /DNA_ID=CAMNT_0043230575 /DNA_START=57 /DNA_END=1811 /DNA_ORIENTATION=+